MIRRLLPVFLIAILIGGFFALKNDLWANYQKWRLRDSVTINELSSQAYVERALISDGEFDPETTTGTFDNQPVEIPGTQIANLLMAEAASNRNILGSQTGEKHIEVDLTTQRIYAYEGLTVKHIFAISSGLPWTPTVTGEFYIWGKVKAQRMRGGSVADGTYYDLPNVPFVMYFFKGYALHGAYWHNDFGLPRSHGCVNLSIEDAKTLYYWAFPEMALGQNIWFNIPKEASTKVIVHGTTPTKLN